MPKALRPIDKAARRFEPVVASAAMNARCASGDQPLTRGRTGTGSNSRRSPRWEKSPSPAMPVWRQRSQIAGMLIGDDGSDEILIGKAFRAVVEDGPRVRT